MSLARQSATHRRGFFGRLFSLVRIAALLLAFLLVLPYLLTPVYWLVDPVSTLMIGRWLTGQRVERTVVSLPRMGPHLPVMVVVAEDGKFCSHYGLDLAEIREALDEAGDGGELRGASTITQQTVKNLFLWPGRSYLRKALEIPLAVWFDLVLSKRRIMEIYLNIAEWGPDGVFGAQAAARRAFNKPAATLTPREAALLAATLPNPLVRDPRRPSPALNRLANLYQNRASRAAGTDCVRQRRR